MISWQCLSWLFVLPVWFCWYCVHFSVSIEWPWRSNGFDIIISSFITVRFGEIMIEPPLTISPCPCLSYFKLKDIQGGFVFVTFQVENYWWTSFCPWNSWHVGGGGDLESLHDRDPKKATTYSPENQHVPWKVVVGRLQLSYWNGPFLRGVSVFRQELEETKPLAWRNGAEKSQLHVRFWWCNLMGSCWNFLLLKDVLKQIIRMEFLMPPKQIHLTYIWIVFWSSPIFSGKKKALEVFSSDQPCGPLTFATKHRKIPSLSGEFFLWLMDCTLPS